ncbi:MAG TPA: hypothetical protein VF133_02290 [Terriglobales bacterium]
MNSPAQTPRSSSQWNTLYEAAMRETDSRKLAERIAAATNAILNRIEESIHNPALGEHCAMDGALRNLRKLAERKGSAKPS